MCSSIINLVFTVVIGVAVGIGTIALFTPGWITVETNSTSKSVGLLDCGADYNVKLDVNNAIESGQDTSNKAQSTYDNCKNAFDNAEDYVKATFALLFLAIVAGLFALIWSILACMACCCKSCLALPLPIASFGGFVLSLLAVIVYGAKTSDHLTSVDVGNMSFETKFGYSYGFAIVSCLGFLVCTVIGVALFKKAASPV